MRYQRQKRQQGFSRSHDPVRKGSDFVEIVDKLLSEDNINKASHAIKALVDTSVTLASAAGDAAQRAHRSYQDKKVANSVKQPGETTHPFRNEYAPREYSTQNTSSVSPVRLETLAVQKPRFNKLARKSRSTSWIGIPIGIFLYGILDEMLPRFPVVTVLLSFAVALVWATYFFLRGKGYDQRDLRYKKYLSTLDYRTVLPVHELALAVGKSDAFVAKELKELCLKNYFPQGRVVENDQLFLLDNATYDQYKSFISTHGINASFPEARSKDNERELSPEIRTVVEASKPYLDSLSSSSSRLSGDIKDTIDTLVNLSQELIAHLVEHPENVIYFDRFTDYYLPTADKLIQKYLDFIQLKGVGDKTQQALSEIESSLTLLTNAFATLLDNLNNEVARDMRSDIHVLNTMLKQEGLIHKDFELTERKTNGSRD